MTRALSAKQKAWRAIHQATSMPGTSGKRNRRQQRKLEAANKRADRLSATAWGTK